MLVCACAYAVLAGVPLHVLLLVLSESLIVSHTRLNAPAPPPQVMRWLILVEDSDNAHLYHSEVWLLTKKMAREEAQSLAFTIPIFEPLPAQYYVRAVSDTWLHAEALLEVSFRWGWGSGAVVPVDFLLLTALCRLLSADCWLLLSAATTANAAMHLLQHTGHAIMSHHTSCLLLCRMLQPLSMKHSHPTHTLSRRPAAPPPLPHPPASGT